MSEQAGVQKLSEYVQSVVVDQESAAEKYRELADAGYVRKLSIGEWWCAEKGCNLAYALLVQGRILVHIPPYKLAPKILMGESSKSGRAVNMNEQGYWSPQTFWLSDSWGDRWSITAHCEHVQEHRIFHSDLRGLLRTQRPGRPKKFSVRG